MRIFTYTIFMLLVSASYGQNNVSKIAFGSCSHEYDNDQMWREIIKDNPDLFIWAGDIVYGDTHDMDVLKKKYEKQKNRKTYQQLLKKTKIIGTWDDHDYGVDDGGKHFLQKDRSKEVLLDFLDVANDDPVRKHQGIYSAHDYAPQSQKVNVILLDCRYFRDTLQADTETSARYKPNLEGDILGETQWQWLEEQLLRKDVQLNIVVSGIQILANEHGFEKWGNFPKAKKRLLDLISEVNATPTLLLSGDRHIAELSKLQLENLPYPLYDFTASGLTHTWSKYWEEQNSLRVGDLIIQKNYGLLEIEWLEKRPKVTFIVKGKNGAEYQRHSHQF